MMMLGDDASSMRPKGRSLSYDDLYALAPAQDGLSVNSKFAFTPLECDEAKALRRVSSRLRTALLRVGDAYKA